MELKLKQKIKNDAILIIALLILICAVGTAYYFLRTDGDRIEVRADGKLYGTFSLDTDLTRQIVSDNGVNLLVIKDGKASIESASCPDGICVSHSPIYREGESIVCLPNKVSVTVRSGLGEVDIIA